MDETTKANYLRAAEALESHKRHLSAIAWEAYYKVKRGRNLSVNDSDIEAARLLRECVAAGKELKT